MAGLTEEGFGLKRYQEILSDKKTKAVDLFGSGVDTSVNSVLGQIMQLSSLELATLWEELQYTYDAFNPNAATGKSLDDLCSLVGVYRYDAKATAGYMEFTGRNGTLITSGTQVSNPDTNDTFITTSDTLITSDSASFIKYQIKSVQPSTTYSLNINGVIVEYTTAVSGDTVTTLRDALVSGVNLHASLDYINALSYDADVFTLEHTTIGNSFSSSSNASTVSVVEVTSMVYVACTEVGSISAEAGAITTIDLAISGLNSVENKTNLVTGRLGETDDELRLRRSIYATRVGKATPEAIARALEGTQGVTEAFVIENRTLTTDVDGRPPKSFEAVVIGGELQDIANTIWDTAPAGIETYGNTSKVVTDSQGNLHSISFSRPESVYIFFQVDYSIYDEESFPSNGQQAIKDAIMLYAGQNKILGKDVIPQRYYGSIFSNVSGIESLDIRVGYSNDPLVAPISYSNAPIQINYREIAEYSEDRISVSEV